MPTWDANLYLKFAKERSQPSLDLIARIGLSTPNRIIDLGCGPGNSTAMLRQRWHDAEIIEPIWYLKKSNKRVQVWDIQVA